MGGKRFDNYRKILLKYLVLLAFFPIASSKAKQVINVKTSFKFKQYFCKGVENISTLPSYASKTKKDILVWMT